MLSTFFILVAALLVDYCLGETKKFHPLVGFGNLVNYAESKLNFSEFSDLTKKVLGFFGWCILVLPLPILYFLLYQQTTFFVIVDVLVLYLAVGLNSLKSHALNVHEPLVDNHLPKARTAVGLMVSRQTDNLSETQISRATIESVLENGHDAVIASLFWFVVGGAPLVIVHRLSNTLDAMWGYKVERYLHFGWFAARADDCLGWPSAKVSAITYVLSRSISIDRISNALINAKIQAKKYKSLNGGWVMAAGASILNIKLGGSSTYHNHETRSAFLGQGNIVQIEDIKRSIQLVERSSWLFVGCCLVFTIVIEGIRSWL